MKKLLFLFWLLPIVGMAQTDSTKVKPHDVYCKIFLANKNDLILKATVKADFGRMSSKIYLSDSEFRKLTDALAHFNNEVDALNYMSIQGWDLVSYINSREEPDAFLLRKKIL